jgi:AraC-like DNA-binding protein
VGEGVEDALAGGGIVHAGSMPRHRFPALPGTQPGMPGAQMVQVACLFSYAIDVPAGHRCRRHRHGCPEVVAMLSGDGVLHQDGRRLPYRAGTAIVYQPRGEHWIEQHRPGRHLCLGVAGGGAERLAPGIRAIPDALGGVIGLVARELAGGRHQDRLDLLAGLVVSYLADSTPAPAAAIRAPDDRLAEAEALLRAHLDRPLAAGEIADALFISPGYLRQLFHRAYGCGPMHRLLALRIARAQELLADGTLPVAEAARRCGFASPFHFSRVFRRLAGTTPSRWRAQALAASRPT